MNTKSSHPSPSVRHGTSPDLPSPPGAVWVGPGPSSGSLWSSGGDSSGDGDFGDGGNG